VEITSGDLRDADSVRHAVRGRQVVFHLGAHIGIPYSYVNPSDVVETNVTGTLNVLNASREFEVDRIIHTSTSEVYGTALYVPMDEGHPLQGQSPYSASKIGADALVESYWRSFAVPATTVRPFNTYGPRQTDRAIIPTIISQALTGNALTLGSLAPTRDFNFVTDTVAGFIAVACSPDTIGESLNLGTGLEISIGDVVTEVGKLLGKSLEVTEDAKRIRPSASEVNRLLADASKTQQKCGWVPRVSLADGLRDTIAFVSEHPNRYQPANYRI
jgi:dTDP-glucose 4,6-dehydratase